VFLNFIAGPKDDTRTPLRFTAVGDKAGALDLESAPVRDFVELMKTRHTALDPTLTAFEDMYLSKPGTDSPSYAAIASHMPVTIQRGIRAGTLDVNASNEARYAASFGAMMKMLKKLYDAGIPLEAGTDGIAGFTLHRELELYVKAGIPAPRVLQIATIDAARLLRADGDLGSVTPGKLADLILVKGDPAQNISDIRNVRLVIKNGELYQPDALYRAVGIKPFN
jgi:hypothetical protein